jgi:ABC-type phosphate transport system substrate-binding protein
MTTRSTFGALVLLATAALTTGAQAAAATVADCSRLPNPVFIAGSSAVKPFLAEIGKIMASQVAAVTIVYSGQGSCLGVSSVIQGTTISGAFAYWDGSGTEQSCTVSNPTVVDIGVSDVFATTCLMLPGGLPSNVGDFLGPVQTMTFVTPKVSTQTSISAEAAYFAYGLGAASGVAPWTDEAQLFQRDEQSGTQRMVATALGVDAARWRGVSTSSSGDLKTKVSTAVPGEGALGILSTDVAQENRAILKVLAYQHFGQTCGYYPDLDETSNEKQNVRDGHYAIWGPLHLLTILNNSGYPRKTEAAEIIGFITGTKAPPLGLDLIALEAQRHVVPPCAMRVRRTDEMGPMQSFAPAQACGCYYEKVANGVTSCTSCQTKADCPSSAPLCSYGYCEAN